MTFHLPKRSLSQVLARIEAGEQIVLARGKKPIAQLVPFQPPGSKRRFDAQRDVIRVGAEFLDPLPESELIAWEQ